MLLFKWKEAQLLLLNYLSKQLSQLAFNCSKSTIEIRKRCEVCSMQYEGISMQRKSMDWFLYDRDVVLMFDFEPIWHLLLVFLLLAEIFSAWWRKYPPNVSNLFLDKLWFHFSLNALLKCRGALAWNMGKAAIKPFKKPIFPHHIETSHDGENLAANDLRILSLSNRYYMTVWEVYCT